MQADVKITLFPKTNKEIAHGFGPGTCQLLEHIHRTGSIYEAAKFMGMAYSKAWRLIKNTETDFNCMLLERNRRGGSHLTPAAIRMIEHYRYVTAQAKAAANQALSTIPSGK